MPGAFSNTRSSKSRSPTPARDVPAASIGVPERPPLFPTSSIAPYTGGSRPIGFGSVPKLRYMRPYGVPSSSSSSDDTEHDDLPEIGSKRKRAKQPSKAPDADFSEDEDEDGSARKWRTSPSTSRAFRQRSAAGASGRSRDDLEDLLASAEGAVPTMVQGAEIAGNVANPPEADFGRSNTPPRQNDQDEGAPLPSDGEPDAPAMGEEDNKGPRIPHLESTQEAPEGANEDGTVEDDADRPGMDFEDGEARYVPRLQTILEESELPDKEDVVEHDVDRPGMELEDEEAEIPPADPGQDQNEFPNEEQALQDETVEPVVHQELNDVEISEVEFDQERFVEYEVYEPPARRTTKETIDAITNILQGHKNVLRLIEHEDFGTKKARRTVRWQFNDAGALEDMIRARRSLSTLPTQRFEGFKESFIWHVVISLLRALVYLHKGQARKADRLQEGETKSKRNHIVDDLEDDRLSGEPADWMPIVHNFINPGNIFLSEPAPWWVDEHLYVRLGNFSRSVVLPNTKDPEDDLEWAQQAEAFIRYEKDEQTGYEAPELMENDNVEHMPGPQSDLFSVGAVAVAMMVGYPVWDLLREIAFEKHAKKNPTTGGILEDWRVQSTRRRLLMIKEIVGTGEVTAALPESYSESLRLFVESLLFVDPLDRGDAVSCLDDAVRLFRQCIGTGLDPLPERQLTKKEKKAEAARKLQETKRWWKNREAEIAGWERGWVTPAGPQ